MANITKNLSKQQLHKLLLLLSVLLIMFFTFVVRETMELRHSGSRGLMLVPFRELAGMFREPNHMFFFRQITLNILLFIPFGFMTAVNLYLYRKNSTLPIWLTVLLLGFAFSLLIEVFQFITGRGYTEVDDIINNTLGVMIGYWLYKVMLDCFKKRISDGK